METAAIESGKALGWGVGCAGARLFERHASSVAFFFRNKLTIGVEDLVQQTYLRAWRSLETLRDDVAAKAWLATILRREHARLFERKPMPTTDISELDLGDSAPGPEHHGEDAVLRAAIARLEPKYREPLVLQVLGGYSCSEIARQLGITESAVMTQVFRARQKLRALLDGRNMEAEPHGLP